MNEITSYNDKLLCSPYEGKGRGLESQMVGTAYKTVSQSKTLARLRLEADAMLSNGLLLKKGSSVYIREDMLSGNRWSTEKFKIEGLDSEVATVEFCHVVAVNPPEEAACTNK